MLCARETWEHQGRPEEFESCHRLAFFVEVFFAERFLFEVFFAELFFAELFFFVFAVPTCFVVAFVLFEAEGGFAS